jgi:hypothetical protein
VLVVVVVEFAILLPPLTLVVVVDEPFEFVDVVLTDEVFDGLLIGVMVDAGDEVVVLFAFVLALVAVLVFDSPGQAAPNKPNVKTAERAITFFISIIFSCLLQRIYIYLLFNDRPKTVEFLNLFWNNGQYKRQRFTSQLKK